MSPESMSPESIPPALEFVYDLDAEVAAPVEIGPAPGGVRRVIPIVSGTFHGPSIQGTLLPGGADWQIVREDGVTELHAHYILATDDGVLIPLNVRGLRHAQGNVLERIAAGETVDPSHYYFRVNPVFQAPEGRYAWMNRSVFIGVGERQTLGVRIRVFRVL